MTSPVERVVFVDADGKRHEARRLSPVAHDGRAWLMISFGGLARLSLKRVRHCEHPTPGTWHQRPMPN